LIVVDGRREEEERINKTTKGGREGEASTVDQLPLSPTSAMTRSLTPPRLRGRNLTYIHYSGPGTFVGLIIKPRHTTRQPLTCNVLCSVPRTGIACRQWPCSSPCSHACTAEGRGLSSSKANISSPLCLLLLHPQTHPTVAHGHDTSSPPQWHALCGLRSTSFVPFLHTALHQQSTPHSSARIRVAGSDPDFTRTACCNSVLDDSEDSITPDLFSRPPRAISNSYLRIAVWQNHGTELDRSPMIRFLDQFETHAGTAALEASLI
jgi:hypothetical protein